MTVPSAPVDRQTASFKNRRRVTAAAVAAIAVAAIAALMHRGPAILLDLSGLAASLWCF